MIDPRRALPSVHWLLEQEEMVPLVRDLGREVVVAAARTVLNQIRDGGASSSGADHQAVACLVVAELRGERPHLRPVINATGILLHTGLGRAPLGPWVWESILSLGTGYSNLEFDLESGERSERGAAVAELLREITGAEAAAIVNNNAGATLLTLRALAAGREVIVSRGQLVEIGGSYRLPDVFLASGAKLVEVGTTNKTRLKDYERAIGPATAALLRVHTSNYQVVGFTEEVSIAEMAELAAALGVLCIDDIGSGALTPDLPPGLRGEPSIQASFQGGAKLVLASGDKLLGGPQCGLILGEARLISTIKADPMMRALRVDKLTLCALEAVLRLVRSPSLARSRIMLWRLLGTERAELRARARSILEQLGARLGLSATVVETEAQIGGGSVPSQRLPSVGIQLECAGGGPLGSEAGLAKALRTGPVPVVPRVHDGHVWLDLKAVFEYEDKEIVHALDRLFPIPGDWSDLRED